MSDVCEWCKSGECSRVLCTLRMRTEQTETETAARIVAWLRAEGARRWASGEDDGIPGCCDELADAIERGDWRNGGR